MERGFFQNAHLGYAVDVDYQGRGLATRASMRVLEKVGFRLIGTAPHYLAIGGEWRDHQLYAITLEEAKVEEIRSNPV